MGAKASGRRHQVSLWSSQRERSGGVALIIRIIIIIIIIIIKIIIIIIKGIRFFKSIIC